MFKKGKKTSACNEISFLKERNMQPLRSKTARQCFRRIIVGRTKNRNSRRTNAHIFNDVLYLVGKKLFDITLNYTTVWKRAG